MLNTSSHGHVQPEAVPTGLGIKMTVPTRPRPVGPHRMPKHPIPPDPDAATTVAVLSLVSPPLLTAADARAVDRRWANLHPDISLMERAGAAAADLAGVLANESGGPALVLAGPGNNGGDALVAARRLMAQGFRVTAVSRADPARLPPDAARAWAAWHESGGTILADIPHAQSFSIVIDGLFGVGLQRDVTGAEARWMTTSEAEAMPGVMAVLTGREIPVNSFGPSFQDQPVLADDRVFHAGDGVAAVAAATEQIAVEALEKIKVEYEPLPAVFDPLEALQEDAFKVHPPGSNIYATKVIRKGDVDKGFAGAYRVFE